LSKINFELQLICAYEMVN